MIADLLLSSSSAANGPVSQHSGISRKFSTNRITHARRRTRRHRLEKQAGSSFQGVTSSSSTVMTLATATGALVVFFHFLFSIRTSTTFPNMWEKWWRGKAALATSKVSASTQTKRTIKIFCSRLAVDFTSGTR